MTGLCPEELTVSVVNRCPFCHWNVFWRKVCIFPLLNSAFLHENISPVIHNPASPYIALPFAMVSKIWSGEGGGESNYGSMAFPEQNVCICYLATTHTEQIFEARIKSRCFAFLYNIVYGS